MVWKVPTRELSATAAGLSSAACRRYGTTMISSPTKVVVEGSPGTSFKASPKGAHYKQKVKGERKKKEKKKKETHFVRVKTEKMTQ